MIPRYILVTRNFLNLKSTNYIKNLNLKAHQNWYYKDLFEHSKTQRLYLATNNFHPDNHKRKDDTFENFKCILFLSSL